MALSVLVFAAATAAITPCRPATRAAPLMSSIRVRAYRRDNDARSPPVIRAEITKIKYNNIDLQKRNTATTKNTPPGAGLGGLTRNRHQPQRAPRPIFWRRFRPGTPTITRTITRNAYRTIKTPKYKKTNFSASFHPIGTQHTAKFPSHRAGENKPKIRKKYAL